MLKCASFWLWMLLCSLLGSVLSSLFSLCVLNGLPSKSIKKATSLSGCSSHEAFCLGKNLLSVLMFWKPKIPGSGSSNCPLVLLILLGNALLFLSFSSLCVSVTDSFYAGPMFNLLSCLGLYSLNMFLYLSKYTFLKTYLKLCCKTHRILLLFIPALFVCGIWVFGKWVILLLICLSFLGSLKHWNLEVGMHFGWA